MDFGCDKFLKYYLDGETVTLNDLLPEDHWSEYHSDEQFVHNSKASRDAKHREQ